MSQETYTVLFSCIGRRVAVVEAFRRAMSALGLKDRVLGADSSAYSSAARLCNKSFLVPQSTEAGYVDHLLDICRAEKVDLVLPMIDPELQTLAGQNDRFRQVGTTLCLSSKRVVDICRDKVLTYETLVAAGIDTPRVMSYDEALGAKLPLFMKPRRGSSARDIHKISTVEQLKFYHGEVPGVIIQEFLDGQEYTLDVFSDFRGHPLCVVPRKRIEVRGGEVVKSMTVRDAELMAIGMATVRAIDGFMGPITIQCFRTTSGRVAVIEINPRLGGGVPLAFEAGADIPRWTIECARGRCPEVDPQGFRDSLVMLRWDDAVFVAEEELR